MGAIDQFSNRVEHYSIDEAFATLEEYVYTKKSFFESGVEIKTAVKRWTGIPTSIGIAPTKTLAKIASKIAKKSPYGVFDIMNPALRDDVLSKTDIIDIWGINKGLANRLQDINIYSAKDLRDMDIRQARKLLTVVGGRIVTELRGINALPMELVAPVKKTLTCSRSFTSAVKTKSELMESLTNYLSTAAEKVRTHNLMTNALTVFIQTDRFRDNAPQYSNSATVKVSPTDSTRELLAVAGRILDAIYKDGYGYKKSGVIFLGLRPAGAVAPRLFDHHLYLADKQLMTAMDNINATFGKRTIRFGLPAKQHVNWKMSRNYLSPSYTTDIGQILRVRV